MPDVQGFWSTIGGLVAIIALIGGYVMYRRGVKTTKPDGGIPLPTDPIIAPELNPAPQILPLLNLSASWTAAFQEASREDFQTNGVRSNCGGEYGIRDNGTGPYEVMVSAIVRETGAMQPFYRTITDAMANDEWGPPDQFYWYPGDVRRWTKKVTGGCNPVYVEYPAGPKPALPADGSQFHVDFLVRARNRYGKESVPLLMSPRVQQHACGGEPDVPTPTPPCP
jgi:hypothetical protein